ncbi:hypothetical protein T484DRAFT_1851137 [Baffinella frigidus]|nr:hypothetical protein T484DRAFT_1851137 [Cryptophyta sp. CCMP2293]
MDPSSSDTALEPGNASEVLSAVVSHLVDTADGPVTRDTIRARIMAIVDMTEAGIDVPAIDLTITTLVTGGKIHETIGGLSRKRAAADAASIISRLSKARRIDPPTGAPRTLSTSPPSPAPAEAEPDLPPRKTREDNRWEADTEAIIFASLLNTTLQNTICAAVVPGTFPELTDRGQGLAADMKVLLGMTAKELRGLSQRDFEAHQQLLSTSERSICTLARDMIALGLDLDNISPTSARPFDANAKNAHHTPSSNAVEPPSPTADLRLILAAPAPQQHLSVYGQRETDSTSQSLRHKLRDGEEALRAAVVDEYGGLEMLHSHDYNSTTSEIRGAVDAVILAQQAYEQYLHNKEPRLQSHAALLALKNTVLEEASCSHSTPTPSNSGPPAASSAGPPRLELPLAARNPSAPEPEPPRPSRPSYAARHSDEHAGPPRPKKPRGAPPDAPSATSRAASYKCPRCETSLTTRKERHQCRPSIAAPARLPASRDEPYAPLPSSTTLVRNGTALSALLHMMYVNPNGITRSTMLQNTSRLSLQGDSVVMNGRIDSLLRNGWATLLNDDTYSMHPLARAYFATEGPRSNREVLESTLRSDPAVRALRNEAAAREQQEQRAPAPGMPPPPGPPPAPLLAVVVATGGHSELCKFCKKKVWINAPEMTWGHHKATCRLERLSEAIIQAVKASHANVRWEYHGCPAEALRVSATEILNDKEPLGTTEFNSALQGLVPSDQVACHNAAHSLDTFYAPHGAPRDDAARRRRFQDSLHRRATSTRWCSSCRQHVDWTDTDSESQQWEVHNQICPSRARPSKRHQQTNNSPRESGSSRPSSRDHQAADRSASDTLASSKTSKDERHALMPVPTRQPRVDTAESRHTQHLQARARGEHSTSIRERVLHIIFCITIADRHGATLTEIMAGLSPTVPNSIVIDTVTDLTGNGILWGLPHHLNSRSCATETRYLICAGYDHAADPVGNLGATAPAQRGHLPRPRLRHPLGPLSPEAIRHPSCFNAKNTKSSSGTTGSSTGRFTTVPGCTVSPPTEERGAHPSHPSNSQFTTEPEGEIARVIDDTFDDPEHDCAGLATTTILQRVRTLLGPQTRRDDLERVLRIATLSSLPVDSNGRTRYAPYGALPGDHPLQRLRGTRGEEHMGIITANPAGDGRTRHCHLCGETVIWLRGHNTAEQHAHHSLQSDAHREGQHFAHSAPGQPTQGPARVARATYKVIASLNDGTDQDTQSDLINVTAHVRAALGNVHYSQVETALEFLLDEPSIAASRLHEGRQLYVITPSAADSTTATPVPADSTSPSMCRECARALHKCICQHHRPRSRSPPPPATRKDGKATPAAAPRSFGSATTSGTPRHPPGAATRDPRRAAPAAHSMMFGIAAACQILGTAASLAPPPHRVRLEADNSFPLLVCGTMIALLLLDMALRTISRGTLRCFKAVEGNV